MKKELNIKEKAQEIAHKRAKRFHQGENHWHVDNKSNIMVCKFCETKIPIWKKYGLKFTGFPEDVKRIFKRDKRYM